MKSCTKTVSGEHDFSEAQCDRKGRHIMHNDEVIAHSKDCKFYPKCKWCGLIDDRGPIK